MSVPRLTAAALKATIALPRTSLPMRAATSSDAAERLTTTLYRWQAASRRERTVFSVLDGPPYANGSLHIGHFLNKVLKDIANRYKLLRGFRVQFSPGWDCHGLPIELKALSLAAGAKATVAEIAAAAAEPRRTRALARECAASAVAAQASDFQAWGVLADWDVGARSVRGNAYVTMDASYEAAQLRVFAALVRRGAVSRALRPVHWSPASRSALAEAELEYADAHVSRAGFVGFPLFDAGRASGVRAREALAAALARSRGTPPRAVIWTTTIWTLPANVALAVNADLEYALVFTGDAATDSQVFYLVAASRVDELSRVLAFGASDGLPAAAPVRVTTFSRFPGSDLVGALFAHPLSTMLPLEGAVTAPCGTRVSRVIAGPHVRDDSGTGIVHTAPGHGVEDFDAVVAANADVERGGSGTAAASQPLSTAPLPVLSPVTAEGNFDERTGCFAGLHVLGAGSRAVESALVERGALLGVERLVHRYPYDWRTRTPVITRATAQWFVSVDNLLPAARAALNDVNFTPLAGRARLEAALTGRSRWCISRQRAWGVPIPVWFRNDTGEALLDADVIEHVARVVERKGSDAWWDAHDDELLPQRVIDAKLASGIEYLRGMDTLDVWFDSGCASWGSAAVASSQESTRGVGAEAGGAAPQALPPPADLVIEGSDQHRGWFQSSLLLRVAAAGAGAPFRGILTHGFVLDKAGHKMSKSRGNVVAPADAIAKVGVDALRFWVASADFSSDVLISDEVLARSTDALKKVRNTLRFLLGVLPGVERALAPPPAGSALDADRLASLWALPPSPRLFSPSAAMSPLDACFLARLQTLDASARDAYDTHSFSAVTHALAAFAARELSAQWCECVKDRLYQDAPDADGKGTSLRGSRTDAQLIAWEALRVLTHAIAPIAPFCADEIYAASATAFGVARGEASIFHAEWHTLPVALTSPPASWAAARALSDSTPSQLWDYFFSIKSEVTKALEALRVAKVIGAGAEAAVALAVPRSSEGSILLGTLALLGATPGSGKAPGLEELLCVADARVIWDDASAAVDAAPQQRVAGSLGDVQYTVIARAASGEKCERCWRVSEVAAKAAVSPKLCFRCEDVVFASPSRHAAQC